MQVDLIAHTGFSHPLALAQDTPFEEQWDAGEMDTLAEFAGRSCYQSWQRPNPATATNEGYLANILKQGHFSVLEHASATFYVQGVSRALTHELIRHRHLSYSQLSQRFVNEDREDDLVLPPAAEGDEVAEELHKAAHAHAHNHYRALVDHYTSKGLPRKQAREAARAVLPNQQETKLVVSGNARAWRDVIAKRNDPAADAEIQRFAAEVLRQLKTVAPNMFQDFEEVNDDKGTSD